jgi:hypothetical protein
MRLTRLERRGYGSRLPVKNLLGTLAAAAALAVVGCNAGSTGAPAPLDRFVYPVGVDFHDGRLLVVSSNFDLAFAGSDGGSVLSVDPSVAPASDFGTGVRIASFGGEIAVVRRPEQAGTGPTTTDCGLPADAPAFALVASRLDDVVYRLDLGPSGALACGPECPIHVGTAQVSDPYGVAVTCPPGGPARAWVGFLRAPTSESWIGTWELADPAGTMKTFQVPTNTGNGTPRTFAYDAERQRLYFTSTNSATAASLRWIELGGACDPGELLGNGGCPFGIANLGVYIVGSELTGLQLATPVPGAPPRLFIAARLYDADVAAATGLRPAFDVGGKLLVVDLLPQADGVPLGQIANTIDIGLGASEVRVVPRAGTGRPDLVAVTASERGTVWIYDDETGAAYPMTDDPVTGAHLAGDQPFGIAVDPSGAGPGVARLYVGSFMDGFVTPFDVPLDAPQDAHVVMDRRIGQEQP